MHFYAITHIFREENQVADYMANKALQGDFMWDYNDILDHHVIYLLQADAYGIFYNH